MYKGEIPFHPKTGDQMTYPENASRWDGVKSISIPPNWRPNGPFKTKMEICGMERGRSAAHFTLRDDASKEYTIFMSDLLDVLKNHGIIKGWTEELTWSFCKRGQNYGVKLHDEQL